jgi:hypothetical protein
MLPGIPALRSRWQRVEHSTVLAQDSCCKYVDYSDGQRVIGRHLE